MGRCTSVWPSRAIFTTAACSGVSSLVPTSRAWGTRMRKTSGVAPASMAASSPSRTGSQMDRTVQAAMVRVGERARVTLFAARRRPRE